jgi:peptidoglycan/xylan/chitin deacetylase (PgdA/CDA1 family)
VERGHQVANHSHAHRWWETLFWIPWAERDLLRASDAIEDAGGVRPAWFRPPIGMITPELHVAAERHGMVLGAWSVRPYDGRVRDPAEIERRLTGAVEAGDVVLLHDAAGPDGSAPPALAALPGVLADLGQRGLTAVTLAELAGTAAYRTHGERLPRPFPRISVFVFCTMMALWWGIATLY